MNKVTMQDVADLAGVSLKTVSRVVNNEPKVRSDTREKIQKIINELNFQPNKSAQSLAADRSLLMGLLYDNPSSAYITQLQAGVLAACNSHGYGLVIHPCDNEDDALLSNLQVLLASSRMDGVILTPPLTENTVLLDYFNDNNIPFVLISPLDQEQSTSLVYTDDTLAAKQSVQHLIDFGHKRIGFILGARQRSGSEMRFLGYKEALEENNIAFDSALVVDGDFTFESGELAAQQLLRLDVPPTAIFASNDYMAAGVMKAAIHLSISVPYELSVCGFDDLPVARYLTPTLTTVQHPVSLLAENAGKLLIKQLKKYTDELKLEEVHAKLVVRESTGPLKV
ncbi:MAG: LacI family DNA-binding transcriptional regulator [Pseudomonadales bacterium]